MKDYLISFTIGAIAYSLGKYLSLSFNNVESLIMFYVGGMSIISLNFFTDIKWFK